MKVNKKLKILLGCIAIVSVGVAVATLAYMLPMLAMKPVETGNIMNTDIVAIKNKRNNLFIIKAKEGHILIDAGSDVTTIFNTLEELAIAPSDIKYVLLTHTDYDHVAFLGSLTEAQIFLNTDEVPMINGTVKRDATSYNKLPMGVAKEDLTLLIDGQKLEIGGHTIECLKAPGHTPGSMMYLLDGEYLFTGDAFKVAKDYLVVHPYSMDNNEAGVTIECLEPVLSRCQWVFTAHYGDYKAKSLIIE